MIFLFFVIFILLVGFVMVLMFIGGLITLFMEKPEPEPVKKVEAPAIINEFVNR
jgi:Na+-transporting methylmalonyl-CoA/oxaloacetate decarboxylase gamma subunit